MPNARSFQPARPLSRENVSIFWSIRQLPALKERFAQMHQRSTGITTTYEFALNPVQCANFLIAGCVEAFREGWPRAYPLCIRGGPRLPSPGPKEPASYSLLQPQRILSFGNSV